MKTAIDTPEAAVQALAEAIKLLRAQGVIRSRRITGDLGEWYVACLYDGERAARQTEKGWDVRVKADGSRLQVKTQSFDPSNQWNYLDSDPMLFDRLVVVVLTEAFTIRGMYDVPSDRLGEVLRVGTEKKPFYHFSDLEPWRVTPSGLPGYSQLQSMFER